MQSVDATRAVILAMQAMKQLYRFALVDADNPDEPEFVGHPFQVQRRNWQQVRDSMLEAIDKANGRAVVLLPWTRTGADRRAA